MGDPNFTHGVWGEGGGGGVAVRMYCMREE